MTPELARHVIAPVLAHTPGVRLAYVFGSVARGTATPGSDVDLAIDAADDVDLTSLAATLAPALGREVDVVSLRDPGVPFLEELLRDGVLVFERTQGAAARFRSRTLADLEIDRPWYERMRDAWLRKVAQGGIL